MTFYNERRYHQALGYRTPRAVFENPAAACGKVDNTVVPLHADVDHFPHRRIDRKKVIQELGRIGIRP